jgi:hypothetical protein
MCFANNRKGVLDGHNQTPPTKKFPSWRKIKTALQAGQRELGPKNETGCIAAATANIRRDWRLSSEHDHVGAIKGLT